MTADKMASKHAFSVNGNTRSTRATGKDSVLVDRKSLRPEDSGSARFADSCFDLPCPPGSALVPHSTTNSLRPNIVAHGLRNLV